MLEKLALDLLFSLCHSNKARICNFPSSSSSLPCLADNKPIVKSLTLPSASLPMKLVSLEEAQARSLSACHPARKERRENSLPEIVPVFHTVLDLPDSK